MAGEKVVAAYTMTGGSGVHSYSKNSNFQEEAIKWSKEMINEAIAEKLDIKIFDCSKTFRVADLGCATGHNTFVAVQNIMDAVEAKCDGTYEMPEVQVFFNDQIANDFNQLFVSLPPERRFFAAGVPGSFRVRLFPKEYLHFVFSSYALQILSASPKELADKSSTCWNKGKICYSNASDQVVKAYQAQYGIDMERFFQARAKEIVHGGLMAIVIPTRLPGTPHSQAFFNRTIETLGSSLADMANKGKISHENLDYFNIPAYLASIEEVEAAVKRNGSFSVEMIESFPQEINKLRPKEVLSILRTGAEGILKAHFGDEILDELFDLLHKKLEERSSYIISGEAINLFILLKRIATHDHE